MTAQNEREIHEALYGVNLKSKGHLSKFINWLMRMGDELPEINREKGGQDFFSKIMNRISN